MPKGKRMKTEETASIRRNKNKTAKLNFFKLVAFIYVVITIIFYISILKMNMLPGWVIAMFTIAEIIFTFAMVVGLIKKHRTYKLTVLCFIIVLLVSGIYIYVTRYVLATSNFLGEVLKEFAETEDYYIVVRKESSYSKIEDIANKDVYMFQVADDVKSKIANKVSITFNSKNNLTDIGNDLIQKNIDVILVSSTQYNMISEEIKDFKTDTKIIYTEKHELQTSTKTDNTASKYSIKSGKFNVYISGIDTSGNISNVSRSDANILATVNTETHEVLLTSIPRDYYVTLHSYGAKDKLTHSGIYGINETIKTAEDILDTDINYYVRVNFTTVIKLVDKLGGIDVYSEYDFTSNAAKAFHYNKGYNHLNGEEALAFSRERYAFNSGDNQRVKNQQAVIEAVIKKVLNSTTLLTKYTDILEALKGSFQTNIAQDDISALVKDQINNMSSWSVKTNSLTGTGASSSTYSMGSTPLYVMVPSSTSVNDAKDKIDKVLGE
jgi:cell envelope-related function transcriptional attenuator common domain